MKLARNLLTQDGAIFISCDESEQARLRLIMDEIFGQRNFVADMVWAAGRKNDSRLISVSHEYIVCYARDSEYLKEKKVVWRQRKKGLEDIYAQFNRLKGKYLNDFQKIAEELKAWYRNLANNHPAKAHKHYCQVDSRGIYFAADISWPGGGGPKYAVRHPITKKPVRVPSRGWITPDPNKMQQWISEDRVHFGEGETSVPCFKKYLADSEVQTPYSVFYQDGRAASKRLRALMEGDYFPFPKDEAIMQDLIGMMTVPGDIIVDLFGGSGTTAHAVLAVNANDGGGRRFILVQLGEECDTASEAFKAGYKTIAEIGKERIRRAGERIKEENTGKEDINNLDIGFRVLKVDTSNMKEVYYTPDDVTQARLSEQVDNIREDRTAEDLLFQVLLDWGVDLALPIRQEFIAGKTVFFVDDNALAACFDTGIDEDFVKQLAARKPLRVVFRDAGFASDSVKINIEQVFKLLSPATEIKTI